MRPGQFAARRGSIGLAMVIVLVFLQLLMVGVVISGARDQDIAVQRLDSTRAGYAAEAGANMAMRELMNDADEDGDGVIGSISDDGNASNDPALGTASVYVSESVAGSETTLTVRGRAGAALRQASLLAEYGASGGGGTTLAAFSRNGSDQPRYSIWNGSAWGVNTAMPDIGAEANHVVLRSCPTRAEVMFVAQDASQDVNVLFFDGSSWGSVAQVCSDTGETDNRAYDAAYEQTSGDGLIVYWKDSSDQVGYRTWNGTSVSSENLLSLSGATDANQLALYARPGTDDIILLVQNTSGGDYRLSASVWNGTTWGSWSHLNTDIESDDTECFSLAFESLSTHALVVYVESGDFSPHYRTWNGTSWSSQSSMPSIGEKGKWLRLAADPTSDTILFGALDDDEDLNVNQWNGSSWGSNSQLEDEVGTKDRRAFDIAFENGGASALIVYAQENSDRPRYRIWNGSAWGSEQNGPDLNDHVKCIFATTGAAAGQVFIAAKDNGNDIHLMQWNGSSIPGETRIETTYGGPDKAEQVMIGAAPGTSIPRLVNWYYVEPQ